MSGAAPATTIFVVGNPRSGTTLLASMLGRHPQVCSTPETLFMSEVQFQVAPWLRLGPQAVAQRLARSRAKHLGLDVATMAGALAASGASSPAAVFATLLETYRARQGRDRVLEKSPVHLRHIDELMAWFPHARVLWIVRDGRACVASLLQVDWASKDPLTLARQWRRNMHFALDAERRWGHRMLRVSYEDLTADPARALAPVFTHLALPPDPRVFDHRIPVDTISPFERAWKDQVNRPLDGGRRDAWQQTLSPAVQARIAPVLNPLLHTLGYATSPATGAGRAAQWLERLRERSLFHPVGLRGLRTAHRWRALLHEHWRLQAG